jgi:hypothetical protein
MSTNKGNAHPGDRTDPPDDALTFPSDAEPTDDSPTIISKKSPSTEPKPAIGERVIDLGSRPDLLGSGLRGRRLAHFELIEPIGVGGMAAVLRACDTQLDRQVALKILPPEMASDPENIRRFHQEAKAAARLDHENIARVFFCGEDQGLHFIAFEFVEGENLRTLLERRGRLPVPEAVRYILQVATGLEHAAERGVVHRDVKPSNIIVSPNGRAKLVDMGLARNMDRRSDADLTQSGVTLGTFDYISPEQALEPREADTRSDIYSLGCTFYHILTGQAPVPEGTAAKKLHHHQHVAPVDPRQLNPDVPDEVALILGRMMAKDPKGRYPRPLQLVQHLMQVARHVGAADDLPEGGLFVDVPLPAGPRSRPMLIVSMSALALAVVIILMALAPVDIPPPPVSPGPANPPVPAADSKGSGAPIEAKIVPAAKVGPPAPDAIIVGSDQLAALALEPVKDRTRVRLSGNIDLTELADAISMTAGGPQPLVLEGNETYQGASLTFRADAAPRAAGLVVAGGKVVFRNLTIRVEAARSFGQPVSAVLVRGAEQVVFEKCVFDQKNVPPLNPNRSAIASVLVEADPDAGSRPDVQFRECYFRSSGEQGVQPYPGGQVAVAVNGPAKVSAVNCAFLPHGAFFHLRPGCRYPESVVQVDHCSGFVFNGPVFRIDAKASADLKATGCLFSRYDDPVVSPESAPDLIHLAEEGPVHFRGEENCYHYLNALLSVGQSLTNTLEQFRAALAPGGYDKGSLSLLQPESPWYFPKPLREQPTLAFQVKSDYARYGIERCSWGELARPQPLENIAENTKVFDPDYKGKSPVIFNSLDRALANLNPGETLWVKPGKGGREIEVPPTALKAGSDVTIEAYPKTSPVLTLGKAAEKDEVAFFRLRDGKLRFVGLHFLLEPRQEGIGSQSVLQLGDSVQCAFDHCVITLKATRRVPLSAIAFLDPKKSMLTETPRPGGTRVALTGSFVRGDGDLVNLTSCRPVKFVLENSLVAVTGSLAAVQATGEDLAADQGPQVELTRVSAFTREPTLSLRAFKNGKGLGCTHVEARSCLFAGLEGRPLVYLESAELLSDEQVPRFLEWKGEQNCFANFGKLLEQEKTNEMGSMMSLDSGRWDKLFRDLTRGRYESLAVPALTDYLWQATPDQFRPAEAEQQLGSYGASLPDLDPLLKAVK